VGGGRPGEAAGMLHLLRQSMPASTKWLGSGTLLTLARLLVTLAALVPGGRMVKWLEEITVTPAESDNFYHFHDNRVLPPGIDQERARRRVRPRARAPARRSSWSSREKSLSMQCGFWPDCLAACPLCRHACSAASGRAVWLPVPSVDIQVVMPVMGMAGAAALLVWNVCS